MLWTPYGQSRAGRRVTVLSSSGLLALSGAAQGTQASQMRLTRLSLENANTYCSLPCDTCIVACRLAGLVTEAHPVRATRRPTNQVMLNVCHIIMSNYSLLLPTNTHILKYYTLSGCYLFRPVAIRNLTTKYLKTHSNKLVLTMLCLWMYRLC
jgi:hypothetical protein